MKGSMRGFKVGLSQNTGQTWSDADLELLQQLLMLRAAITDGDRAQAIRLANAAIETLKARVERG